MELDPRVLRRFIDSGKEVHRFDGIARVSSLEEIASEENLLVFDAAGMCNVVYFYKGIDVECRMPHFLRFNRIMELWQGCMPGNTPYKHNLFGPGQSCVWRYQVKLHGVYILADYFKDKPRFAPD